LPSKSSIPVPIIRILETPEFEPELLPQILREINDRQWHAVLQVLIEAKFKAEAMLRNDEVFSQPGKVAYYQGWVAYADYILSSFEGLRNHVPEPRPGPEPGPET